MPDPTPENYLTQLPQRDVQEFCRKAATYLLDSVLLGLAYLDFQKQPTLQKAQAFQAVFLSPNSAHFISPNISTKTADTASQNIRRWAQFEKTGHGWTQQDLTSFKRNGLFRAYTEGTANGGYYIYRKLQTDAYGKRVVSAEALPYGSSMKSQYDHDEAMRYLKKQNFSIFDKVEDK